MVRSFQYCYTQISGFFETVIEVRGVWLVPGAGWKNKVSVRHRGHWIRVIPVWLCVIFRFSFRLNKRLKSLQEFPPWHEYLHVTFPQVARLEWRKVTLYPGLHSVLKAMVLYHFTPYVGIDKLNIIKKCLPSYFPRTNLVFSWRNTLTIETSVQVTWERKMTWLSLVCK